MRWPVVGLLCLFFISCSAAVGQPQHAEGELQRELLQQLLHNGPLAPFAPRQQTSDVGLADLVKEFALRKRQDDGVPSSITPVVIVPSLIGSKLQAQLDGYKSAHWYCWTEWKDWFTIWVNWQELAPLLINCWFERMSLHLDASTGRSYNTPGVNIRYMDYGGVDGVTYLDDSHAFGIWNNTVAVLEALGWEVGKNLRSAPYDWRFGPETYAQVDWPRLRGLIEDTFAINNNSKVSVVSLSMGGPYFLGFLNQQTQAWKDKYIHTFVSFDGAFGGSPSATTALIALSSWWASKIADPLGMRSLVQSWPSIVWMLPLAQIYGDDFVWVNTVNPPRNYTTANFAQLLAEATAYNASKIFRFMEAKNWFTFDAPGVECHSFFGTNVTTPLVVTYNTTAFDTEPVTVFGNGDGVVPEAGLRLLERWRGKQAQPIYSYPIDGLFHGSGVQNKQVLRMFLEILFTH